MKHYNLDLKEILSESFMTTLIDNHWKDIPIIGVDVYVEKDSYWRLLKAANEQHRHLVQKQATNNSVKLFGIHYIEAEFKGNTEANMYGIITRRVCNNVVTFYTTGAVVEKVHKPNEIPFTASVIFE